MKKMSIALEREIMQAVKSDYSGLLKIEYHSKMASLNRPLSWTGMIVRRYCLWITYLISSLKCLHVQDRMPAK